MPSALPEGEPAPADGSFPPSALDGAGRAAVRVLRARAVLHGAVRLLRLQHLHRERARGRARRVPVDVRRRGDRRGPPARRVLGTRTCRSRRCSSAAARRRCCRPGTWPRRARDRRRVRARARRRGHHRVQPRQRRRRRRSRGCATAGSTGCRSGCSRRCPTCSRVLDRTHDPRAGAAGGATGPAQAGFDQVSLDLIYGTPGESLGRLGAPRSTPRWPASRTTSRRTP